MIVLLIGVVIEGVCDGGVLVGGLAGEGGVGAHTAHDTYYTD